MALSDNLVAYWNFDEASGDLLDQVNSHDGTLTVAPTQGATGIINDGYDFEDSGTDQYITVADANDLDINASGGEMSWSLWIKPESLTGNGLFQKGTTYPTTVSIDVGFDATTIYLRETGNSIGNAAHGMSAGNWYHIVVTTDSSTHTCWVNGVKKVNHSESITFTDTSEDMRIGVYPNLDGFDGIMDEFGIWTRVLTDDEISDLYNSGSGLAYPFPQDATVTPSALALSTSQGEPVIIVKVAPVSISSSLNLNTVQLENVSVGASFIDSGTIGSSAIRNDVFYSNGVATTTNPYLTPNVL